MGCEGCARIILLGFNLIFFLVGAAALGVGIWVLIDGTIFLQLLAKIPDSESYGGLIQDAAYIFIAAGAAIFVLAFLGCCGAWKRNKCMLITYSIIIGVLLAMEIACVVVAYFFSAQVVDTLKVGLATALSTNYKSTFTSTGTTNEYKYNSSDILSKGVDALQIEFSCCGVNNYTDYGSVAAVPYSCCNTTATGKDLQTLVDSIWGGEGTLTVLNANCLDVSVLQNKQGCYDAVYDYVTSKSTIFMAIGGAILGVQVFLIIFACCVACASDKDD